MSTQDKELLADAIAVLLKIKNDRKVWLGEVGLNPARREDVNDILRRHQALTIAAMPRQPKEDRS